MSYRTAILIDRYVKTFSDSDDQPQRTTTVQYNSTLSSDDDTMREVTTAAIGNYPTHSIPDVISSPYSVIVTNFAGKQIVMKLEKQTNLQSTHRVTIDGITYVRVPYRYGYIVNASGKKVIYNVSPGEERFVWHSNLAEEAADAFDLESYLVNYCDWTRLDQIPEGMRGTLIYTEDIRDCTPGLDGPELPENYSEGRVWPALKIFTDADFKAVYLSDDSHYYFLVEHNGKDVLIGDLTGPYDDGEYRQDSSTSQFLRGNLLPEPIDAAIMNEEQEEIVTVDMKFGDEWYRVEGSDEVVHVITPEQGSFLRIIGTKIKVVDAIRNIATELDDEDYKGLSECLTYVTNNGTEDSETGLWAVYYPNTIQSSERDAVRAVIGSSVTYIFTHVKVDDQEYNIILQCSKLQVIKALRYIADELGDEDYSSLSAAKTYVNNNGTTDSETGLCAVVYPNTVCTPERDAISELIESLKSGDTPKLDSSVTCTFI